MEREVLNVLAIDIFKSPILLTDILLQAEQKQTSKQSGFIAIISCTNRMQNFLKLPLSPQKTRIIPFLKRLTY
jgi:hypothetical protein